MKTTLAGLVVAAALVIGACDFNIADPNSPSPLGPNATAAQVDAAAVGLLAAQRIDVDNWVLKAAVLGREGYRLDTAEPRYTTELLAGPFDASNDAFGGGQWRREYRTITSGYQILNVIGSAQIPAQEQSGVRGFVHTIQALSFLMILDAHSEDSIPIDVNRTADQLLAPLVTNDSAYKAVVALLDSGRTELLAGGSSFPFDPGPGFVGFNTPATFVQFNRALMARVRAYQASLGALSAAVYGRKIWSTCAACWDSALTALTASFLNKTGPMDAGAYDVYSGGNQDTPNALSQDPASAIQLAHPSLKDSAETQSGSSALDKRFLAKTTPRGNGAFTFACLTSGLSWTRYPTPSSPIPIIRNEELILLDAEAQWFGATGSKVTAISDLNTIRQTSGGLLPTTVTIASTDSVFENELLKQRLYSLVFEGGHRWIDMRRYGRLREVIIDRPTGCAAAGIPKDTVFSSLPVNSFEVQARQ